MGARRSPVAAAAGAIAALAASGALVLPPGAAASDGPATRIVVDGLPVYVQRTSAPWVSLRAYVRAGRNCAEPGRRGLADLVAAWMAAGGSESLPAAEFDAAAEALGARITVTSDRDLLVADLAVDAERLHPAARLFADLLMYPAFDPGREDAARATAAEAPEAQDATAAQARAWLGLPPPPPPPQGPAARRPAVLGFHREHVGVDSTVLVLSGPFDVDPEREIRAAFLGFRRAGTPCPAGPSVDAAGRSASVAAHGLPGGRARLLVGRTGTLRSDPGWLPVLVGLIASAPSTAENPRALGLPGARLEQRLGWPDVVWFDWIVADAAAGWAVAAAEQRLEDARRGLIAPAALEQAVALIERTLLPAPDAANAAGKHALLEALGVLGEDPAARIQRLRALDRVEVSRALVSHTRGR